MVVTPAAVAGGAEDFPFVDTKAAGSFHIKFAAVFTGDVDWIAIHN